MSYDMETLGGVVSFNDFSPEAARLVLDTLKESGAYEGTRADLAGATNWTEIFKGLGQELKAVRRGCYSVSGEGRWINLKPFFTAASAFMEPGSWMVTINDNTDDLVDLFYITEAGDFETTQIFYGFEYRNLDRKIGALADVAFKAVAHAGFKPLAFVDENRV